MLGGKGQWCALTMILKYYCLSHLSCHVNCDGSLKVNLFVVNSWRFGKCFPLLKKENVFCRIKYQNMQKRFRKIFSAETNAPLICLPSSLFFYNYVILVHFFLLIMHGHYCLRGALTSLWHDACTCPKKLLLSHSVL